MYYYDVTLEKEIAMPSCIFNREDWEPPYIVTREIQLPFLPFEGLELFGVWQLKEVVQLVKYSLPNTLLVARVTKDNSISNLYQRVEKTMMDERMDYYVTNGWKK